MKSSTYGQVTVEEMAVIIKDYIASAPEYDYTICVGCDSQNTHLTKVVVVVAVHRVGKGGIYFYEISHEDLIKELEVKIYHETKLSLDIASEIKRCLEAHGVHKKVEIHCDIGRDEVQGKTYKLINWIVSWVTSEGYECKIKPESYTASCIADRLSK